MQGVISELLMNKLDLSLLVISKGLTQVQTLGSCCMLLLGLLQSLLLVLQVMHSRGSWTIWGCW